MTFSWWIWLIIGIIILMVVLSFIVSIYYIKRNNKNDEPDRSNFRSSQSGHIDVGINDLRSSESSDISQRSYSNESQLSLGGLSKKPNRSRYKNE